MESDRVKIESRTTAGSHDPAAQDSVGTKKPGPLSPVSPTAYRGGSVLHSYPWYISDWRDSRARARMSIEQRGLYREILDLCYKDGSVPSDEEMLRTLCGATEREWKRAWPVVSKQFASGEEGELINPRASEQLPELIRLAEVRHASSKRAANARWKRNADRMLERSAPHANGNASGNAPRITDASISDAERNAEKCRASALPYPALPPTPIDDLCSAFIAAYPERGRKKQGLVERWYAANLGPCVDPGKLHAEIMAGLERAKHSEEWMKLDGKYICGMLPFLEGKRWIEEWPEAEQGYRTPTYRPEDWE